MGDHRARAAPARGHHENRYAGAGGVHRRGHRQRVDVDGGEQSLLLYDPKSPVPDSGKEVLKSQLEFMAVELFSLAVAEVVDVSVEGSM